MSFFKRLFGKVDSGKSDQKRSQSKKRDDKALLKQRELIKRIEKGFNISELKTVCFEMGIDYENLEGETKKDKVLSLVRYCHKFKRLDELTAVCENHNPYAFASYVAKPTVNKSEQKTSQGPVSKSTSHSESYDSDQTELEMEFHQYRAFVRDRFTLDEFLDFLLTDEDFQQFGFNIPANVTHDYLTRETWHYARRRKKLNLLLEKFKAVDLELFMKYVNADEV